MDRQNRSITMASILLVWTFMNSYFITVDKLVTTSYNCRGAMANGIYIQELMESSDILCVQEHLLHNEKLPFSHH